MKLASVEKVLEVNEHPNADRLELVKVLGWEVVVQKGLHKVGDLVCFITIDTIVPSILTFDFMENKKFRVKPIKLRKKVSNGLLLPLSEVKQAMRELKSANLVSYPSVMPNGWLNEGADISNYLGIAKYEKPVPACLSGNTIGYRPSYIKKTDEDNLRNDVDLFNQLMDGRIVVSIKVDGSSWSCFFDPNGKFHVCSRKMDIERNPNNTFWKIAIDLDLENKIKEICPDVCIQGELYGEGVNGNHLGIKGQKLAVFNLWHIKNGSYLDTPQFNRLTKLLDAPTVEFLKATDIPTSKDLDAFVELANKQYYPNERPAEGIVLRSSLDANVSGKIINENYKE